MRDTVIAEDGIEIVLDDLGPPRPPPGFSLMEAARHDLPDRPGPIAFEPFRSRFSTRRLTFPSAGVNLTSIDIALEPAQECLG